MIDTLLHYYASTRVATLAQALAELKPLGLAFDDGSGNTVLDRSRCVVCDLVTQKSTETQPRVTMGGLAIWCATDAALAASLWALPNNVARLQGDRASGNVLQTRVDPLLMASVQIEPVLAGSRYPFG